MFCVLLRQKQHCERAPPLCLMVVDPARCSQVLPEEHVRLEEVDKFGLPSP